MPQVYAAVLFIISLVSALKSGCVHENTETLKCTYFPKRISDEISRVRVVDFIGPNGSMAINSSDFNGEGWNNLEYLEISNSLSYSDFNLTAETFSSLMRLNELQIHLGHLNLDPDTFVGLNSVKSLDVSDCFRLSVDDLLQSLNGTNKLPNITKLTISRLNEYHPPNVVDESFGQILQEKTLTFIDLSNTEITELHLVIFKYLRHLKLVNVSGATIGNIFKGNFVFSDIKNIDFDLSHVILPQRMRPPPGKLVFSNIVVKNPSIHAVGIVAFIEAKIVNASSIIPALSSIWIHNITLIFDEPRQYLIQRVTAKNNNLKYLDLHMYSFCNNCIASRLENIDLSYNGLEFINPFNAHFAPNIKILDLSFNQLFEMAKNNGSLFEILLKYLSHLKFINLSANDLNIIPVNMFDNNVELRTIDLSGNKLRQVTFVLKHLEDLQALNLQRNLIHILDETSMTHLDSMYHLHRYNDSYPEINLKRNNLSCSTCDALTFIQWLLNSKMVNITAQNLVCTDEHGQQIDIQRNTLDVLHNVCYFVFYNVVICLSVAFISVGTAITSVKACKIWHRDGVIQRLREGCNQYRYAALLVYHEDDILFAKEDLVQDLRAEFRHLTNIEDANRQLIKESEDVDPGHAFGTELGDILNETSVVIAVASVPFCTDARYGSVIEEAREIGKPIILFLIDGSGIDRTNMTPVMKQLFRVKPRIVWKVEKGERKMQTTWTSVCNTILDHSL